MFKNSLNFLSNKEKGQSQNGRYQKTKPLNFLKNEHLLPLDTHTQACVLAAKKCCFSENLACFSWNTRFEICPFALLLTMSVIFEFFVLIERQDSSDLDRSPLNMVLKIAWLASILEIAHGVIAQSFMQWNDMFCC